MLHVILCDMCYCILCDVCYCILCDVCYCILCDVYYCILCDVCYCILLHFSVLYRPVLHCSTLPPGLNLFAVNNNNNNNNNKYRNVTPLTRFKLNLQRNAGKR